MSFITIAYHYAKLSEAVKCHSKDEQPKNICLRNLHITSLALGYTSEYKTLNIKQTTKLLSRKSTKIWIHKFITFNISLADHESRINSPTLFLLQLCFSKELNETT